MSKQLYIVTDGKFKIHVTQSHSPRGAIANILWRSAVKEIRGVKKVTPATFKRLGGKRYE